MTLQHLLRHAVSTPDKPAVVADGRVFRYAEIAAQIALCHAYLANQNLPREGVAVLGMAHLLDQWVAGFALRALGLTTAVARNDDALNRLGLKNVACIVTSDDGPPGADAFGAAPPRRLIAVPAALAATAASAGGRALREASIPAGGHILLTSGTTGRYKKLLWTAQTEALAIPLHARINGISAESVVYVASFPLWTAAGYRWPLSTWTMGGTLVLHEGDDLHEPLNRHALTHAFTTPAMLAATLASAGGTPLRRNDAMRLMVAGGALPRAMLAAAKTRLTAQVYSVLASTEAMTIAATPLESPQDINRHRIHPSRDVEIVDESGAVLEPGRIGALRIRIIDGVRGYLDDDEATRASFRDGWFYPGDLGEIGGDGRLILHGRTTDVVNILGNKIATAPIERALQDRLGARGVCIVTTGTEDGDTQVHLAIEPGRRIAREEIDAAAAAELGMIRTVPIRVTLVKSLPRNAMGKVRREVLKQELALGARPQPAGRG